MHEIEKGAIFYSLKQGMRDPLADLIPANLRHQ
jgi:hypothetical protein